MYKLSKASIETMKGVHPNLVEFMKELIAISPHDFKITQGVRTAEYQNILYQQGRTRPGNKVTGADGYRYKSNHQIKYDGLGYAVDIGVLKMENGKLVYKGSARDFHFYKEIYHIAVAHGLTKKYGVEWGGNCFKNYVDGPHWQIKGASSIAFK